MAQSDGRTYLYLSVAVGNLLALTTGMTMAWTSSVLPKLKEVNSGNPLSEAITSEEDSWIGSLLALGAAFGPFPFAFLADRFGRKLTLISIAIPYIIAYLISAFAENVILFCIARFIGGLSVGGLFTVLPMYIAEISEDVIRGMLGASINTFLSVGLLTSYVIGPYISIMWFSLICAIIPLIFMILFFLFMNETPYHLSGKGNHETAAKALSSLRSRHVDNIQNELSEIKTAADKDKESAGSIMDIFRSRGSMKALLISVMLVLFQQMSGINVVLFNAQTIFEASGTTMDSSIPPMIIGAVQFTSSFVSPIAADKLGRKALLLFSGIGMFIAEVPLGVYFYLQKEGKDVDGISWLPVLTLVLYIITYNTGFGPLPWTVMAEIFPGNIKSAANSITAFSCWFISFLIVKFFNSISDGIGLGGSFWIFSGFSLLAALFTFFFVPETKGKSFQEIQDILSS